MNCRICTSPIADFFDVKEMIFGLPGIFTYGQCTTCGCVQIKTIPEQLHLFYPNNYYSLKETNPLPTQNSLKATILKARDLHYFGVKKSFFGFLINKLKPGKISSYFLPYQFIWETLLNNSDASIHDVGCGNGTLLQYFSSLGYKNLSGSDPFLDKEINYPNLKIEKKEWSEINQNFDAIMMNHVLEHSINPKDFLVAAYQKLKLNGKLLVRIPMADSIGFEKYKENWVGMEAPRHIHLFTQKSFSLLAKQIGFKIYKTKFDSIGWHFLSSEGYKKGVFLKDQRHTEMYSAETIQIFEQEAASANKINKGDTCAFYLEKI